jgi:hypothetical protein
MRKTKVNWDEAQRMRNAHFSYSDIARKFGVTRQHIQQHFHDGKSALPGRKMKMECIPYPALREWFKKTGKSYTAVGLEVFGEDAEYAYMRMRNLMIGKTRCVPLDVIRKLCEVTGMTFEEMFGEGA